jgi:hypothetical protein
MNRRVEPTHLLCRLHTHRFPPFWAGALSRKPNDGGSANESSTVFH